MYKYIALIALVTTGSIMAMEEGIALRSGKTVLKTERPKPKAKKPKNLSSRLIVDTNPDQTITIKANPHRKEKGPRVTQAEKEVNKVGVLKRANEEECMRKRISYIKAYKNALGKLLASSDELEQIGLIGTVREYKQAIKQIDDYLFAAKAGRLLIKSQHLIEKQNPVELREKYTASIQNGKISAPSFNLGVVFE